MNDERALQLVGKEFNRVGIILESDQKLPCVTALVAGERMRGSWWSHPEGKKIWHVLNRFVSRPDVLTTRLVSGKVTFIHRNLWPDFLAVGSSKEGWQTDSLSPRALGLIKLVERRDEMRTDDPKWKGREARSISDAARELERRLLVHSEEVHTAGDPTPNTCSPGRDGLAGSISRVRFPA